MTITAAPLRLDDPSFVIDYDAAVGAAAVQLKCAGRRISTDGNQEFEDVETFCNPGGEAPGIVQRSITVEVLQSVGAGGLWNQMQPLEGELVKFAFLPKSQTATGVDNPEMHGDLYIPFVPLVDAGVRKFSVFTLEFKIYGTPLFNTTASPIYASHAA